MGSGVGAEVTCAYLNGCDHQRVNTPQQSATYTGGYVTDRFFKIVGVSPVLGHDFAAGDSKAGAEKVIILGHEIWQRDLTVTRRLSTKRFRLMAAPPPSSG